MTNLVPRRPNGRPQACDPCRARKVACDHTQPVCNRCLKRGQETECIYTVSTHAVPASAMRCPPTPRLRHKDVRARALMAQGRPARAAPASRRVSLSTTDSQPMEQSPRLTQSFSAAPSETSTQSVTGSTARASRAPSVAAGTTYPPSGPGYLGYTSYSTIYEETRDSLSNLQGKPAYPASSAPSTGPSPGEKDAPADRGGYISRGSTLASPTSEMCLVLVRSLPDLSKKVILPKSSCNLFDGWVRIAGRRILQSFQAHLPSVRDESSVRELANLLCKNSVRKVNDDLADPDEWIEQFTGENVRWESLGLLFTFSELSNDQPGRRAPRSEIYQTGLEVADMCIDLSMCMSGGNLMLLFLCYRRTLLESQVLGDAGLSCWRAHAETVSLFTFLGLHAEAYTTDYTPTFCSELRRKLYACVFNCDKVISFQGRPPFLSRRFISTPLPLDVADETFFEGPEAVAQAASALDYNGWNRESKDPSSATVIRARTQMAIMRDELMEISLGNNEETSIGTLLALKIREAEIVAAFPPSLQHTPGDLDDSALDIEPTYCRMLIRLEHFQNLFFAERLLLRRGHLDTGDLLLNSFEMVTMTLNFWMHKDRFAIVRTDFEWLVMAYAAPGGGILCMELLKPTFTGPHPQNPGLSRSSIVQRLSLLVGFLGWVSPDAPNADLCANCKTVIQHVLDHTLNGGGGGGGGLVTEERSEPLEALEQFDANQLNFNLDLLDTFEWLRTEEMHFF